MHEARGSVQVNRMVRQCWEGIEVKSCRAVLQLARAMVLA